jgi:hypothetical protein
MATDPDLVLNKAKGALPLGIVLILIGIGLGAYTALGTAPRPELAFPVAMFIILVGLACALRVEKVVFWRTARTLDFYRGVWPFVGKNRIIGFDEIRGLQLNCRKRSSGSAGTSTIMLRVELVLAPDDCPAVYTEYDKPARMEEVGRQVSAIIGKPLTLADNYRRFLAGDRSGFTYPRKNDPYPLDPGT